MSVKVTVESGNNDIKYPCLMKNDNGKIVLFSGHNCGTCLNNVGLYLTAGEYSDDWAMSQFSMLNGKIILENEQ